MARAPANQRLALAGALTDYEATPGRYPLALREPRVLFDEMQSVLLLAAGRPIPWLEGLDEAALRRAARFFVRSALLRPGNDPLGVLGLVPGFAPDALREHYRLLIRMTHPDFAAGSEDSWPADAAQRINTAHAALQANPGLGLNAAPAGPAGARPAVVTAQARPAPPRPAVKPQRIPVREPRRWWTAVPLGMRWAVAVTGLLASAVALLMHNSGPDQGALVARKETRSPAVPGGGPRLLVDKGMALSEEGDAPATRVLLADKAADPGADPARNMAQAPADPHMGLTLDTQLKALPARTEPPAPMPTTASRPRAASPRVALAPADTPLEAARPAPMPAPAPVAADPALPLREPVAAPVHAHVPAAVQTPVQAPPTLAETQATMVNVLASLQSGSPEQVLQWVEPAWREHPAARAFAGQYRQLLAGRRVAGLGRAAFDARESGAQLVVHGTVELRLQETTDRPQQHVPLQMQLRAHFQNQQGRPVLTELVAAQAQP